MRRPLISLASQAARWRLLASLALLAALNAACHRAEPDLHVVPATTVGGAREPAAAPAIAWYKGSVDAAFAHAQAVGKPVFLFWGAVWCPYCKALKASVFTRRDFIEKLQQFVPVYLDGDDPGAQRQGEVFQVSGYPTVVILKSDRTELLRLAGGMDLNQYPQALDLALADVRPVASILASLNTSQARLSRDDCRGLAYNAWDLEESALAGTQPAVDAISAAQQLALAADRCPANTPVEQARLILTAAGQASRALDPAARRDASPNASSQAQTIVHLVHRAERLLADETIAVSAADAVSSLDRPFFAWALRDDPAAAAALRQHWVTVTEAIAADSRFDPGQRLQAVADELSGLQALEGDASPSAELVRASRARVTAALAETSEPLARAGVVNAALHVFDALNEPRAAYALAVQEIAHSNAPYYYMADAAEYAEALGNATEAMHWYEQAYQQSHGPMTRPRWGISYVRAMLRLQPANEAQIVAAVSTVLGEFSANSGIGASNRARLEKLAASIRQWNLDGAHRRAVARLRPRFRSLCARDAAQVTGTCAFDLQS